MAEERSTLARPYATAAFQQAQEEGKLEQWSEMLGFLRAMVSDPTMAGVVADPRVERGKLVELILGIAGDRLSKTGQNFVKVLVHNGRMGLVAEITELFEKLRGDAEGRTRVDVVSAFELAPDYARQISEAMAKRLAREVDLTVRVDQALIGGVIIRAGDLVIDASLRGRLQQLAVGLRSG